jgi:predicted dehydrogenase
MRKILVVGVGSIGSVHAKYAKKVASVGVVDSKSQSADKLGRLLGVRSFGNNIKLASDWNADGIIISTPNDTHVALARYFMNKNTQILIEKPLSHSLKEAKELINLSHQYNINVFVVCNMRFHPAIRLIKDNISNIGRVFFARAHYGNYLPNMRTNVDYRNLYVADRNQGGVVLDSIHELDYLSWLFGPIKNITAKADRLGDMEIESENYSSIINKHKSGVYTEVHLDFLRPVKRRGCEIVGELGILDWQSEGKNPEHCKVSIFKKEIGWKSLMDVKDNDPTNTFKNVMENFIDAINGKSHNLQNGTEALALLSSALKARRM